MALYLVTGGAGFIGSALVRTILQRGERVRVLDNFATGHRSNLAGVFDDIELFEADVRNVESMRPACRGVDYVLHLAALASVPRSIQDPLTTHLVNAGGTLHVLMAARDAGVKRVVYAASSAAYGDTPDLPQREAMPPDPISPYAVSKLAGELYSRVFTSVYGLETVCVRYFNVFGPRQDPASPYSGVLSLFISALLEGKRPTIFGDGEQSRDFTYVDNAVDATLRACAAPHAAGTVVNVATGEQHTLNATLASLKQITGSALEPIYAPPRPGDIRHSQADIHVARELLGYQPLISFEEGLKKTVSWYQENGAKCRATESESFSAPHPGRATSAQLLKPWPFHRFTQSESSARG